MVRRYWVFGLIVVMVALHAMIIVNVRKELTRIQTDDATAVDLGEFEFQAVADRSKIYQMRLYAILEPGQSISGRKTLRQQHALLSEVIYQNLRLAEQPWLSDPLHTDLKHQLKIEISKSMSIDFLEQLIVTHWLEIPTDTKSGSPAPVDGSTLAAK